MKRIITKRIRPQDRRSPHGGRGLKLVEPVNRHPQRVSLPARGAWIETGDILRSLTARGSLPARGAWIETR